MLAATLFLSSSASMSKSSERNDYQDYVKSIKILQPSLKTRDIVGIANALQTVVAEGTCKFPWQILLSIAYVESSLIKSKVNNKTKDYGLMQISRKNIVRNKWDIAKILKDEVYNLRAACLILNYNQDHFARKISYWLGLYRSGLKLSDKNIVDNAVAYDKIVRTVAKRIGYTANRKLHVKRS